MKNTLIPLLLSVLMLTSACGGSSGVAVQPVGAPDEQLDDGEDSLPDDGSVDENGDDTEDEPSSPDGEENDDDSPAPADGGNELPDTDQADTPSDDDIPVVLPPSPQNLRANRYSDAAGEIFWDRPEGVSGAGLRYIVSLDERELERVSTQSYFIESLRAGEGHLVSVATLDAEGLISEPVSIRFNTERDLPPPVYDFELAVDRSRAALQEGEESGTRFIISVAPQGEEEVSLSVQGQSSADAADISVSLNHDNLHGDQLSAELTLRLPVGMRPIQPQERRFNVVASSGEEVRIAELILDVKPIAAPDVYLLIGQSNMVGSSEIGAKDVSIGGLDQRNGRIWQLNVAPNNRQIFSGFDDFLAEENTVIEPHYIEAEDPLHDPRNPVVDFKGGTTIGPALTFAKQALADTTQRIYLVPAAWGASGFCLVAGNELAWNASDSDNAALGGTGLLERALTRLRMTMRETGGVLRGILWHQGGADSNSQACADAYERNLQLMVERIRREAPLDARGETARGSQAPIPFIAATQSRGADERGDYSLWSSTKVRVDAVHRNIGALLPYADWVNNDDLVPPAYPCGSSSCVHFGATANREIGRRYYEALKRIWER